MLFNIWEWFCVNRCESVVNKFVFFIGGFDVEVKVIGVEVVDGVVVVNFL